MRAKKVLADALTSTIKALQHETATRVGLFALKCVSNPFVAWRRSSSIDQAATVCRVALIASSTMANARTTPCATQAPHASSGRSARCQLNVPQPPREVRVHFATDSSGSSEDFTDAQALHHQHSRHFRPVCDREHTPNCGSSSSGREPQRGPSADPERGTRSSAVSDPPPGVVRGAFGSRRQIGYPKADGSPQRPSPAPLVKAQSFIISQFQREASVRIQHNRLGDEMVALRWSQFAETLVVQTLLPIFSLYWACARRTGVLR